MGEVDVDAVIVAFHIDPQDTIEVGFCRVFNVSNLRDAGVIDQDMNAPSRNLIEG